MSFPSFVAIASAVVIGVVIALVSLFEAPWQILLLFLLLVLAFTEWLLAANRKPNEALSQNSTPQAEKPSIEPTATVQDVSEASKTLLYRGAPYKAPNTPTQESLGKEVSGKYRGGIWRSFTRSSN
jgi:membrane protein implicated in regulation of membrane protease activity